MKERNKSIDILKLILIALVVTVHLLPYKFDSQYQTNIAYIIHSLGRVVVPLFFIISGYFIKDKIENFNTIRKISFRFFKMFVVWQLIYSYIIYLLYSNNSLSNQQLYTGIIYGFGHLWYLNATFLGVFLVYFMNNLSITVKLFTAITLILIGYTLQLSLELKFLTSNVIAVYNIIGTSRNFLFFGFPYLLIGTIFDKISLQKVDQSLLFFLFCLIIEGFIYLYFKINVSNIYISAIPLSIFIFKYVLQSDKKIRINVNPKLLLGTYLIHFYAVFYLTIYYPKFSFGASIIKILLALLITIPLFYLLNFLDKKIKLLF